MISFIQSIDTRVLEALFSMRDARLVRMFIDISEFGTVFTICGLAICIALALLLHRKYAATTGLAIALAMSGLCVVLGKGLIERARPPFSFRAYTEIWYSFPSSHAALSATLYGYVIFLIWTFVPSWTIRVLATLFFSLLVLAISFSRIYLGVHYLSDVVVGTLLGAFCAWLGYQWLVFAHKP